MGRERRWVIAAVSVCGAVLLCIGAVFLCRAPVLLVSDEAAEGLYGGKRAWEKRVAASLALFRRVRSVRVGESAGADAVAFAAEAASARPVCVLFPYRYLDGALRYQERQPEVPVAVLGGRIRQLPGSADGALLVSTGAELDYYRAGRCAAIFAGENGGEVLFYRDETLTAADRESFTRGLRDGGWDAAPRFVSGDAALPEQTACAVIAGNAGESFWKDERDIPALLFSWLDPALSPRKVKVVFDDSPWAQARQAARRLAGGGIEEPLPSEAAVIPGRVDKALGEKLALALGAVPPGEGGGEPDAAALILPVRR
ncbi:MAG: hypothetical protein LBD08_00370 [Treponema sp.]|nr:hypothetical protein [Treponema sp.]